MTSKTLLGVVLAGILTFLWGFAFWGATTTPYQAWDSVNNDAEVQARLAELFPESGYYSIPSMTNNSPEQFSALTDSGVWAMVNIDHSPPQQGDPIVLGLGLAHNIVVMFLLALLIKHVPSNRLRTALFVGVTAAVYSNMGDVVWWNYPLSWKGTIMVYDLGFWLLGGLVLSYSMRETG